MYHRFFVFVSSSSSAVAPALLPTAATSWPRYRDHRHQRQRRLFVSKHKQHCCENVVQKDTQSKLSVSYFLLKIQKTALPPFLNCNY